MRTFRAAEQKRIDIKKISERLINVQLSPQPTSIVFPPDAQKTENAAIQALKNIRAFTFVHEHIGPLSAVDVNGAMGPNKTTPKTVRYQTDALWLMRHGLARGSMDLVNAASSAFAWGFDTQNGAGYFENAMGPNGTAIPATDAIEADTFFIAAFANAYKLVLGQPELGNLATSYATLNTALSASLAWMEANNAHIYSQATQTPNRLMFAAVAFVLGGGIISNSTYQARGVNFATTALGMRHTDGYFIEKGGYDSSYQGVIIMLMSFLWMHATDATVRSTLKTAIETAVNWELTRIDADGQILTAGNSRTGPDGEVSPLTGKVKWPNYSEVSLGLFYSGFILERMDIINSGARVIQYAALNWQTLQS